MNKLTKWEADYKQAMEDFREANNGRAMAIQFVPMSAFPSMIHAAACGDKLAKRCANAFIFWDKSVKQSQEEPACFCCDTIIRRGEHGGNLGGIAYCYPVEEVPDPCAMITVACHDCAQQDLAVLLGVLKRNIGNELSVTMESLH